MEITEELRKTMTEWVELKKQLAEVRKDVKVLNDREKQLKESIKKFMESQQIDKINLKKGKVTLKTTHKKSSFTKKAVESGLLIFFNNDAVKVESVMNCIMDNIESKDTSVISLTGIKD
jgi:hypothetical protein